MIVSSALLRPRDTDALRAELRQVAAVAGVPILFGGEVHDGTLLLSEFVGTSTNSLRGIAVPAKTGLGGRVVDSMRPASVEDYRSASTITHHFDGPVGAEGIRSILAVPVVVDGKARAVLYAATRDFSPIGGRTADVVLGATRRLTTEIAIRDEVDRRTRMWDAATTSGALVVNQLRSIEAELHDLAAAAGDAELQSRLQTIASRVADLVAPDVEPGDPPPKLTPREHDVLSYVALGCTNQEVAQRLSIGPETVKSYLRTAMVKLDARSRFEAVVIARKHGLLA